MIDVRSLPGSKVVLSSKECGHFPVILRTGPNEAIAAIRGGAGHVGIEGNLQLIRSSDRGETWSDPEVIAGSDWDDRNPALGRSRKGTVVLAYHHQGNYDGKWDLHPGNRVDTFLKVSQDEGRTWSDPFPLSHREFRGRSPYGRMINVGSTLIMPIYGAAPGSPPLWENVFSYILRSRDDGRTWSDPTTVARDMNETSFLNLPDGELLAILRSQLDHPASLYSSRSKDGGYSWTEPVRITGDSEHPGDLVLLSNGWLLLVYGHRHPPYGVQGMVSTDSGQTWETKHKLVFADDRPGGDCGYPSVTLFVDGRVVVIYYSAGDHMQSRRLDGAFSKAVLLDEEELVRALRKQGVE